MSRTEQRKIGRSVLRRDDDKPNQNKNVNRAYTAEEALLFAESIAAKEGYTLIDAKVQPPQVPNQIVFGITLTVVAKYPQNQVPGCAGCGPGFHPDHYPNLYCRSGAYPHCTCDGCF